MFTSIKKQTAMQPIIDWNDMLNHKHLRIDDDSDRDLLELYALCATEWLEEMTGLSFLPAVYIGKADDFEPDGAPLQLPRCPAMAADAENLPVGGAPSLQYFDTAGELQTYVVGTDVTYDYESEPARFGLIGSQRWASTRRNSIQNVFAKWSAGFKDLASVPAKWKHAALRLVTHWYEMRTPVDLENAKEMPVAWNIQNLILNGRVQ